DGIRDFHVTGVQTCALPIYVATVEKLEKHVAEDTDRLAHRCVAFLLESTALDPYEQRISQQAEQIDSLATVVEAKKLDEDVTREIGRASCRERVWSRGRGGG